MTKNVMLSSMDRVLVARAAGRVLIVSCALTLGAAFPAGAQDFRQTFSLSTPGARANAMGQAFIGVADDASAMITNPAGLVLLTRPQAYVEFKTGNELTDEFGIVEESPGSVSFFGASAPLGSRVAVGFSYHEYFGYRLSFEDDPTLDFEGSGDSWGGTVAFGLTPDLSVGATFANHNLSFEGEGFDVSESAFGVDIGGLWRASSMVSVGVNFAMASDTDELGELMPNRFGAGVGIRPSPRVLIASDVTWIDYSAFLDTIDDSTQFHIGGEYLLLSGMTSQLFARAGLFTVPDDEFSDEGGVTGTFGAGVTLGRHFQADFAVLTDGEVVISAGVRF